MLFIIKYYFLTQGITIIDYKIVLVNIIVIIEELTSKLN